MLPSFDRFRPAELTGYRIGWMGDYEGYLATEPGVMAVCEAALAGLSSHGVAVENCQPDYDMARLWETWLTFRHWALSTAKELYDDPALKAQLRPEIIWEIEGSFGLTAARVTEAAIARGDWYKALHALFERYDILALPTAQVFPFDKTVHWPKEVNGRAMDTYHRWMEVVIGGTLSGNPVANVPAGFDERGRPMGIQLIGRMSQDKEVLELAMAWEAATDYLDVRPTMVEA